MNSLRSPHLIHKFICTHILPSLMSWKGLQGQSHHSALDLLFLISTQEFVLSMIHLFSWFFNFSLLLITMESSSSLFKPKKNNKQNSHYTACLLQLSLSIFFFLLSRLLESSSFSFAISLLFIQSFIKYDLASAPTNPQKLLILKSSMTSSMLKPEDSWFFLTRLLWNIVFSPFWNPLLNFL